MKPSIARLMACAGAVVISSWPLLGCGAQTPVAPPATDRFDRHDLVTATTVARQTVVTGFLLGDRIANLAVVVVDSAGPGVRIHALEGNRWTAKLDARLPPRALFVDVIAIAGRDRLVTYEPGRLRWFDPESLTYRPLLAATSSFVPRRRDEVAHVDLSRDVNEDGRDDIVVPVDDGFRIFVQRPGGTFADPVTVGRRPDMSGISGADGYRYDPWSESRVYSADYDGDGKLDLIYWNGDHFAVHRQGRRGSFSSTADRFTVPIDFATDDRYALARGGMTGRILHSIADVNGDSVPDVVVVTLRGERIRDKRSAYEVYFGTRTTGATAFDSRVDILFQSPERIQIGMRQHDLDRDGRPDLLFTTIDRTYLEGSLWKRIKGFMGDDVWLTIELYRNRGGTFAAEPTASRRIALDGVPSPREPGWVPLDLVLRGPTHEQRLTDRIWPRAFNSTLLLGDVTGDRRAELIIGHHPRQLELYVGLPGDVLLAPAPHIVQIDVPNDGEYVWLADLNRDGREDVVMHYPFVDRDAHGAPLRPPGTERQRVTTLLARSTTSRR